MNHQVGTFPGAGGLPLFCQSWLPQEQAHAVLAVVHGMGDHSGRFLSLVEPLVERGTAVHAFDLRGFGRSPGRKGHINSWDDYRSDLRTFLGQVRAGNHAPVFLLGYSLGAAIALDFAIREPQGLSGVVLIGTPIEPAGVAPPSQILLARVLSRLLPHFSIAMHNDIQGVSRDPAVLEALQNDPFHHNRVTARWGAESLAATEWIRGQAHAIRLPVLFLHGESDPFNLVGGTRRYFDSIPYPDKQMITYPGSRHEIHNDLDREQVARDITGWLEEHLP